MSTHNIHFAAKKTKNKITKIISIYMLVNYSSVEMTGNYSPNIQQNTVELTLSTRGKKSTDDILIMFLFFPGL